MEQEQAETTADEVISTERKPFWREFIEAFAIAIILAVIIRTFFLGMYWVPSESMVPTIRVGDRLAVAKFSYLFVETQRGDVIVFKSAQNDNKNLVKRLIGLPGEEVAFKNNQLLIDGVVIDEPYLPLESYTFDYGPIVVPENQYFVCGDNRLYSSDSRTWGFVAAEEIIGRGVVIYWPLGHWNML